MTKPDTITLCRVCLKIIGARWDGHGWRTYQHKDIHDEPYCEGGGRYPYR